MTTHTDPHEAEVRRIAEVLAMKTKPGYYAIVKAKDPKSLKRLVNEYMQAARAMVAEMVTLYISALIESGYSKQIANELAFRRGLLACMPNVPHMPLVNDGETHWYNAECESCGWYGSSQYLDGGGQIADTGDYNDCYCPWCGSTAIEDYCPPTKTGE